jgi:hypothetical protein
VIAIAVFPLNVSNLFGLPIRILYPSDKTVMLMVTDFLDGFAFVRPVCLLKVNKTAVLSFRYLFRSAGTQVAI